MEDLIISLREFIRNQFESNQFLAGGMILGLAAAILHRCRNLPAAVWSLVRRNLVTTITVDNTDEIFQWLLVWLSKQPYSARSRRLMVRAVYVAEEPAVDSSGPPETVKASVPRPLLSPGVGRHMFFYRGRLIYLERERKEANNADGGFSFGVREMLHLTVFHRDRQFLQDLLEEAKRLHYPPGEPRVDIYRHQGWNWIHASSQRIRPVESVILSAGKMELLVDSIQRFLEREQWYYSRSLPWRFGVLLHGPPGSGKTSVALAVASHFGWGISVITLSSQVSDDMLGVLIAQVPRGSLILLEDVDCGMGTRSTREASLDPLSDADSDSAYRPKVTLSGLLNALDGVSSADGRVVFMTTNHVERLDPALIRPGRADLRLELTAPTSEQALRLFCRFFPEATPEQQDEFVRRLPHTSMASLQTHFLVHESPDASIAHLLQAYVPPYSAEIKHDPASTVDRAADDFLVHSSQE